MIIRVHFKSQIIRCLLRGFLVSLDLLTLAGIANFIILSGQIIFHLSFYYVVVVPLSRFLIDANQVPHKIAAATPTSLLHNFFLSMLHSILSTLAGRDLVLLNIIKIVMVLLAFHVLLHIPLTYDCDIAQTAVKFAIILVHVAGLGIAGLRRRFVFEFSIRLYLF